MASPPASGRNWVATLYESGVSTGKSATIQQTDMPVNAGWIYFRLATSYVFTTTSANAYVWKLKSTTANSGTVARNGAASRIACLSTDDRNGSPTTTDTCWIGAHNCTGSAITVTVDGTGGDIRGSGTSSSTRQVAMGLYIGGSLTQSLAILKWDTSASATLSVTAYTLIVDGGELQMGTVASPYPSSFTATLICRQGGGGTPTGILRTGTGRLICQGASRTYYSTTYVSGTGISASPLVVSDAVSWVVGDRIAVTATSANGTNYNETEYKFIKTVNSANSYVLSDTSGGAESAFTYTHNTNAKVLLLTRNVNITNSVANQLTIIIGSSTIPNAASGDVNIDWTYIKGMGNAGGTPDIDSLSGGFGILIRSAAYAGIDYCVFDTPISFGIIQLSSIAQTYTGNIFCAGTNAANATIKNAGLAVGTTGVGHTFVDHYFIGSQRNGVYYAGVNCTFTNPHCSANNIAGTSENGGFVLTSGAPCTVTTGNFHANRIAGVVAGGTSNSVFTSCEIGTKGANQTADVLVGANTANKLLFNTTNVGSTTLVSGYTSGAGGATLIAFDTLNNTANNHKWYTEFGSAQSTGSGLSDTTVRTSGTLNVRLAPENSSTGFKYEYQILAVPSKAVFALGFIERNAAFATDTCLVELFLPGSTVADASQTMATTVGTYLPFSIAATYNGTVSRYATVRISAKTTTASAYVYIADLFNGTNNITNFNTWYQGQPSMIMFEQLGDAAAVWAVPISTMTTSGTIGYYIVKKLLSVAKFLSLK